MSKDAKAQSGAAPNSVPWMMAVAVADVPPAGRHVELKPDETARKAIAKVAGVVAVQSLQASFDLAPYGSDGLRVTGRVTGTVEQNCAVTLEPLSNEIDEEVDLLFTPPPDAAKHSELVDDSGDVAGSPAVDAPEELNNGTVDLAALTVEFFVLGIDPYARKPGAVFEATAAGEPIPHPFAALAALKKDR